LFTAEDTDGDKGKVEWTIQHPNVFLTKSDGDSDWLSTPDDDLWGHESKRKSVYDPCPSGWRVPVHGGTAETSPLYGFTTSNGTWSTSSPFGPGGWSWDDNALYPGTGSRPYGDGTLSVGGMSGNYWSATPNDNDAFEFLHFSSGYSISLAQYSARAYGFSVRCVKE
jgi:hypothetical protein